MVKRNFYDPEAEHLERLALPWIASFSGGKDSTSLVTWIEWLRRSGWLTVARPTLVMSDTGVEYPELQVIAYEMIRLLEGSGWRCHVVRPAVSQRLYCRILGIGNTPIHPGITRMRWCTRATKIDPMDGWRKTQANGLLSLTGLRLGESAMRDGKLKRAGCAAGGECGIPDPDDTNYSPIINWRTCHVVDWLSGHVRAPVVKAMKDVFAVTQRLVDIYGVKVETGGFDWADEIVTAARFGCIGCPAIGAEAEAPRSVIARHGVGHPLNELYDVWFQARRRDNRCFRPGRPTGGKAGMGGYGPVRMAVRQHLFGRVMDIQRRAGVVLISPEDEAFIRDCWDRKVYPRGWTADDEKTVPPSSTPLYATEDQ